MTEPAAAISMQSSLASLEARRNDRDEIRSHFDKTNATLTLVRNRAIEIDTKWRRESAALRDDLARVNQVHERDMARLADMERRLEIMRGEV